MIAKQAALTWTVYHEVSGFLSKQCGRPPGPAARSGLGGRARAWLTGRVARCRREKEEEKPLVQQHSGL